MPDAQAVGQRRIDQLAFLRHFLAHRAGPVVEEAQGLHAARQAQQDDADVIDHRQQHLAQDLGLRLDLGHALGGRPGAATGSGARQRAQAAEAVQPGNQPGHRIAIADFQAPGAILDMVAGGEQQGGDARIGIEVERSHDQGHAQGVLQYRFAGTEQLVAVGFARQPGQSTMRPAAASDSPDAIATARRPRHRTAAGNAPRRPWPDYPMRHAPAVLLHRPGMPEYRPRRTHGDIILHP
jgi:hypothetical protein